MFNRFFGAIILAPLLAAAAAAQSGSENLAQAEAAAVDLGPAVGSQAPLDWAVMDQTGTPRRFADMTGPSGLVIFFNRSLDWCGYCKNQTMELEAAFNAFSERGYGLAVLTHDDYTINARYAAEHGSRITLLSDPEHVVIDGFDVRDPVFIGRSGRFDGLPFPIGFVIAPDGTVLSKFWHEPSYGDERGYRTRVATEDVIYALDQLGR